MRALLEALALVVLAILTFAIPVLLVAVFCAIYLLLKSTFFS